MLSCFQTNQLGIGHSLPQLQETLKWKQKLLVETELMQRLHMNNKYEII